MPDYAPLTQEEKDAIIARHHFIVDEFNKTLGGALQYEDDAILAKMEDPKQVAIYRMFQENERRNAERKALLTSLESKYGRSTVDPNPMDRTIAFCFKLGNDPKDIAYNEKLYQEYINDPDKIVYREYSKLFKLNPKSIYDLDAQQAAEFYMENTALCQDAYAIQSVLEHEHTSQTLRDALGQIKKGVESLNEFGNIVAQGGLDGLACPTLTPEQAAMAMSNPLFMNRQNTELNEVLYQKIGVNTVETPHSYFQKFEDYGINIDDPDFLVKYKAVRTNPETGARENVNFEQLFVNDDPNVRIEKRSKDEIFQMRAINRAFQDRYAQKFQSRISARLNQMIFNVNQIEDEHKGGWF